MNRQLLKLSNDIEEIYAKLPNITVKDTKKILSSYGIIADTSILISYPIGVRFEQMKNNKSLNHGVIEYIISAKLMTNKREMEELEAVRTQIINKFSDLDIENLHKRYDQLDYIRITLYDAAYNTFENIHDYMIENYTDKETNKIINDMIEYYQM